MTDNEINNKANDEAINCLYGIIYLGKGFSVAFLLTHWYPRAFGNTCGSNLIEFLIGFTLFFVIFVSASLLKIFLLGVTPFFDLQTPEFV